MDSAIGVARRPLVAVLALAAGALAIATLLVYGPGPHRASASSHAEAPLISQDPRADNTDLYAFVSPDDTSKVTIIANYIPLEAPASGPNFYSFDDTVLYQIKVDQNGDGRDDIAYQFRFNTRTRNPNTFLYNTGPITSLTDQDWNRPQTYSVTLVHFSPGGQIIQGGPKGPVVLGSNIPTPPDNIGPRSTPNYASLASSAVTSLPGGYKVFAGQRDDPFFVDLGSVFDLLGLRPFNPLHIIPLPTAAGVDALKNYNTHSIAIQVPISQLVQIPNTNVGIYATASRQLVRTLDNDGTADNHGPWVQVSRLGEPLVNEVLIPLGKKDYWNREDPSDDSQFAQYYAKPEVAGLENALYPVLQPIQKTDRTDLQAILLTGVPGLNFTGTTQSDLLRLNMAIKPGPNGACPGGTASAAPPDRLGVLDADLCGFPNGRRLGDDVVDIEVRAIAQGYGSFLAGPPFGLKNLTPNNMLGDGVDANDVPFSGTFPYVATPHQGYEVP